MIRTMMVNLIQVLRHIYGP